MNLHLDAEELLAVFLIIGMIWRVVVQLVKSNELLRDVARRVEEIERRLEETEGAG